MPRTNASEAGFTVLEITVTVSVLTLVLGSLLGVFVSTQRSQAFVTDRSESLDELRIAMDRVTKEIRQATTVSSLSTGSTLIATTYVNGSEQSVTWRVTSGGVLERVDGVSGTVVPVLSRMTLLSPFTYSPSVSTPLVIRVKLMMKPRKSPNTILELSSEIRLRNRK